MNKKHITNNSLPESNPPQKQPQQNPEPTKTLKSINKLSLISFALFVLVLTVFILAIQAYCNVNNSWLGTGAIVAAPIIMTIPIIAILILTILILYRLIKYRKQTSHIPLSSVIFTVINLIELPILILVYTIGLNLRTPSIIATMQPTLNEHFPKGYEILAYCENVNEGGGNSSIAMIESASYDKPIAVHFNWRANVYNDETLYEDNYNYLKRADRLNYQKYINQIFNQEILSVMSISDEKIQEYAELNGRNENETYRPVELSLLLPVSEMKNKSALKNKLTDLASKYGQLYNNEEFHMYVYFADQINTEKTQDYYTFFSNSFGVCTPEPSDEIANILKYELTISIDNGQNIQTAIDRGFSNVMEYLNLYNRIHYDY